MNDERRQIDDYALAAFIVGKVPGRIREQIFESLASDEGARQLLAIVYEALLTAGGADDAMRFVAENWKPAA